MRRAAFLDLNGTLVRPVAPERLAHLAPFPGVLEGIARLCAAGFIFPVFTVQSRIAKGLFTFEEFTEWLEPVHTETASLFAIELTATATHGTIATDGWSASARTDHFRDRRERQLPSTYSTLARWRQRTNRLSTC